MQVVIKEPGKAAYKCDIPNTVKSFQERVGGRVEPVLYGEKFILIVNEEGMILDLPINDLGLYGNIIITKIYEGMFCELTDSEADILIMAFNGWC